MTPAEIALVRDSFAPLVPVQERFAKVFYDRLFTVAPELRALFTGSMAEQRRKLMAALAGVVAALDAPERLVPEAQALARSHAGYGVRAAHYALVGAALIYALRTALGRGFTAETEAAWSSVYAALSGLMIDAACAARAE